MEETKTYGILTDGVIINDTRYDEGEEVILTPDDARPLLDINLIMEVEAINEDEVDLSETVSDEDQDSQDEDEEV